VLAIKGQERIPSLSYLATVESTIPFSSYTEIVVSFLFVVMMFNIQIAEIHEEVLRYLPVSGIIGLILGVQTDG
jgi:hypothetical protein